MPYIIVHHGFCCDTGGYSETRAHDTLHEALMSYWVQSAPDGSDGYTTAALYDPDGDRLDPCREDSHEEWARFRLMCGLLYMEQNPTWAESRGSDKIRKWKEVMA